MSEIKDGLYHAETGIPGHLLDRMDCLPLQAACDLEYGQHARRAALDDRYGQLTSVPLSHKFTLAEIFEVEVEQGRIVKFAARLTDGFTVQFSAGHRNRIVPHNLDLILVCTPSLRDSNNLFVKTLWLCERDDSHKTLDKSKYIPYKP